MNFKRQQKCSTVTKIVQLLLDRSTKVGFYLNIQNSTFRNYSKHTKAYYTIYINIFTATRLKRSVQRGSHFDMFLNVWTDLSTSKPNNIITKKNVFSSYLSGFFLVSLGFRWRLEFSWNAGTRWTVIYHNFLSYTSDSFISRHNQYT